MLAGCHRQPTLEFRYREARLKLQQGYVELALREAERGYLETENRDQPWNHRFRLLRAEALIRLGKTSEALSLLEFEPPSAPFFDLGIRRKILQAQALCQTRRFQEGEDHLKEAEGILSESDRALLAESALVRGKCAWSESKLDVTQEEFRRAARLAEHNDDFIQASALGNLGVLLMRTGRYVEAIDAFQSLLVLVKPMHSPVLEEKVLGNLGECYAELGDWRQSLTFSQQATNMAADISNRDDQGTWLINVGRAHFALWELAEAEKSYLEALSIAQQRGDRKASAACFNDLSLLALRRKDTNRAEGYWRQGEALDIEGERLHFAVDEAKIAAARKQLSEAERLFAALLPRTEKDLVLRSAVQRDLAKVYWQQNRIGTADRMFREGINTAERALLLKKRPEDRMSFMDQTPFYDSYIQFQVARHMASEAINTAERSRAQVLAAALETKNSHGDPTVSVGRIQALLGRRKQLVLAYSMTDEESFLWVITPHDFKVLHLPGHAEISIQIEACNKEIQDHRNLEDSPGGQKLYQTLIQPAEELIPRGSSVVIVPSKLLSLVNFEALIVPGAQPHYWIDDVDVQVTGSLALLASAKPATGKSPPGMKELLSMGAPVEVTKEFPTLKHAPEEMQRVQGRFPSGQMTSISGKEATPQAYRDSAPGRYRFIHFDTHGVASDLSPLDSAIILSPGADNTYKLYAREIKDIPLRADLVTISACYGSGTRWYQGEGLVGLTWAFLRAGAHQVVGALWEVDEASSPQLMDDFYGELTQGKSAAEALRDAKLKMLHSNSFYRHPYYWASLQLYTGS
jgi:CHAT domain-containing protein